MRSIIALLITMSFLLVFYYVTRPEESRFDNETEVDSTLVSVNESYDSKPANLTGKNMINREEKNSQISVDDLFNLEELHAFQDNLEIRREDKIEFIIDNIDKYDIDSEEAVFLLSALWGYNPIEKTDYLLTKYQEANELLTKRNLLGLLSELTYPVTYKYDFLQIVHQDEITKIKDFVRIELSLNQDVEINNELISTYVNIADASDGLNALKETISTSNHSLTQDKIDELFLEVYIKHENGKLLAEYLNDGVKNKSGEAFITIFLNYTSSIAPSDFDDDAIVGILKYLDSQKDNKIFERDVYLKDDLLKEYNSLQNYKSGLIDIEP